MDTFQALKREGSSWRCCVRARLPDHHPDPSAGLQGKSPKGLDSPASSSSPQGRMRTAPVGPQALSTVVAGAANHRVWQRAPEAAFQNCVCCAAWGGGGSPAADLCLPPQVLRRPSVHAVLLHRFHVLPLLHVRGASRRRALCLPIGSGLPALIEPASHHPGPAATFV